MQDAVDLETTFVRFDPVLGISCCAGGVRPGPKITVHFDSASTEIRWKLTGNTRDTHGTFRLKGGQVTFDPATGVAAGELLVDLATGESGNSSRDSKMQTDVLESSKYPEAFFHPTKITGDVKAGASRPSPPRTHLISTARTTH